MEHLKNYAVIADAKTILMRAGKGFRKLQRIGLQRIQLYFLDNADL